MLKLGIIGATGYVGEEIVRLLARRKDIEITTVVSNTFEGETLFISLSLPPRHF